MEAAIDRILGSSPGIVLVRQELRLLGPTKVHIHLRGPTGSGKELAALAVHELSGRPGAFIALNCAELAGPLGTSRLWGHRKGAFTDAKENRRGAFDLAADGTLFLDEVGELPLEQQTKLLRVLEDGLYWPHGSEMPMHATCRIVSATNRPLEELAKTGSFREELIHRLLQEVVSIPALKDRREDIPTLAASFLKEAGCTLSPGAIAALKTYPWPGNVRELRNMANALAIRCAGRAISQVDVLQRLNTAAARLDARAMLEQLLASCGGNVTLAARQLGITRQALHARLRKHGLRPGRTAV